MAKTVLTIDDSSTVRKIVAKNLKPFGVNVIEAENGLNGVEAATAQKPDLVLLDYNMPVMDGYQTLEKMRSIPELKHLPVIMLTTETVKETVVRLIKLGLNDYVAKPFTREYLLKKLNPILKLYEGDAVPAESELTKRAPVPEPPSALVHGTILAIDDKQNVLNLLKEYIGTEFKVVTADNGWAAKEMLARTHVDWIILDLDMPDMNGFQFFEEYKKLMKHLASAKKVVAMSLRTARQDIAEAEHLGITEFLYKPFTREDVAKVIRNLTTKQSSASQDTHFSLKGNVKVLTGPATTSPSFNSFLEALGTTIPKELNEMADEGLNRLVVHVDPSLVSDVVVVKKLLSILRQAHDLTLTVALVAESAQVQQSLREYAELATVPVFGSVDGALASFA
jgi:DNA-binding response OmpR family regulator